MKPILLSNQIIKLRRMGKRNETLKHLKMFKEMALIKLLRPYHQMMERISSLVEWKPIMTTQAQLRNSIVINLFS